MLQLAFALYPLCLAAAALSWTATARAGSRLVEIGAGGSILAFAFLAGPWAFTSYYLRYALPALFIIALLHSFRRTDPGPAAQRRRRKARLALAAAFLLAFGSLNASIVAPRPWPRKPLDLSFPLAAGTYYVLQGGNSIATNPFHALGGSTQALDIVRLNSFGNRARSIAPDALDDYEIYGDQVLSPCAGTVLRIRNDLPDNAPGRTDAAHPEGNHVAMSCAGTEILLAHLKPGSVAVAVGTPVAVGQPVGQVGNSGNTLEPHLHVGIKTAATETDVAFGGRRLSMNSLVSGARREAPVAVPAASAQPMPFKTGEPPEERWGYRDATGKVVIAPRFAYAGAFSEGLAPVWIALSQDADNPKRAWIYIGLDGRPVGSRHYEAAGRFQCGRALVRVAGEFVFIDSHGEPSQRLDALSEPGALPAPTRGSGTLRDFGQQLGALTPEFELKADPSPGEQSLTLYVRALRHGVIEIREVGWEGDGYTLSIPHLGLQDGISLAKRILGRMRHTDFTKDEVFPGETTLEIQPDEFIRIRPARYRAGGIEIEHTRWFG